MYFKPPQNNLTSPFYHPLNEKLNEQKLTKARVMFKGSPSDARRDMRVAKETGLYQSSTEKPSGRGRVYEITFKSEGQFRRFMSQFEVDLMEYPLKESRDDFDYLDIEAAMQDAKLEAPKVVKTRKGYQVMVYSRKVKKFIPQGPPHRSKAAAEKDAKMFEDVQLDEKVMTFTFRKTEDAREFESKAFSLANSTDIMMMPGGKTGVEVSTMGPKDDKSLISLAKKMGGRLHKVVEDVQVDETNFRFPQPGEYYGDLGKSISDDPYDFADMSKAELKKRSQDIQRKFASVMRKHKRTKVGEVLDILDKDGGTKLYKDSDIKQIGKYLTKFKDNVRKVAHQMLIDVMEGDDYLAKKRIPVREDVQLDEKKKPISTRLGDAFDSGELEDRIKSMSGPARKSFMNLANSLTDFYHSMGDIHQVDGRQLEDKIDGSPPRVRKMFAKLLDEEVTRLKEPHRVQKKKQTRKAKPIKDDVQIDEVTGETTVVAKSDRNQYERITRALTAANRTGKIKGYEGAHFNERTGMLTLIFDSKAHKPASERRKVAKMIKDFGLEFSHSVEEGFASDAQRRAAFASGYKAKGKKKKEGEEVEEGLRQAMSGPKETAAQKQKRQEKDNFDLYKKRQKRIAALRGDKSSRELTPKQQRDYLRRVNLDQIRAMEEVEIDEAKGTYSSMSRRGIEKPLMAFIADLEDELKKVGIKYSDRKVDPDDVMKAYNADMSPKDAAAMIKKKA